MIPPTVVWYAVIGRSCLLIFRFRRRGVEGVDGPYPDGSSGSVFANGSDACISVEGRCRAGLGPSVRRFIPEYASNPRFLIGVRSQVQSSSSRLTTTHRPLSLDYKERFGLIILVLRVEVNSKGNGIIFAIMMFIELTRKNAHPKVFPPLLGFELRSYTRNP